MTNLVSFAGPSIAADMVKTGTCLLGNCQVFPLLQEQEKAIEAAFHIHANTGSLAATPP